MKRELSVTSESPGPASKASGNISQREGTPLGNILKPRAHDSTQGEWCKEQEKRVPGSP